MNPPARRLIDGWISLSLMAAAVGTGLLAAALHSLTAAALYGGVTAASVLVILAAFCAKCPCRLESCRHLVLGPLTRLLPQRRPGPCTLLDIGLTAAGFAAVVAFPHYWLVRRPPLLAVFWALVAAVLIEIGVFICRECANTSCPVRRPQPPPTTGATPLAP